MAYLTASTRYKHGDTHSGCPHTVNVTQHVSHRAGMSAVGSAGDRAADIHPPSQREPRVTSSSLVLQILFTVWDYSAWKWDNCYRNWEYLVPFFCSLSYTSAGDGPIRDQFQQSRQEGKISGMYVLHVAEQPTWRAAGNNIRTSFHASYQRNTTMLRFPEQHEP
jgi:hypothetical protein